MSDMKTFWDRRADEDAFFFVDNRLDYRHPDLEQFWAEGERDLDRLLGALDVEIHDDERVLEIGSGVGRLTRVIAARAASVLALDVSERMLEIAKRHHQSLTNVKWILGDGSTLRGIDSSSVDACISHVVFQHIPDAGITLGYVREIGRVLRPGGWAAFQISNDPRVHEPPSLATRARNSVRSLIRKVPKGQHDARWLGSMVEIEDLRLAAADGSMTIERLLGEGTQFCLVLTRRA
jgi:SAM-dependent methyltransferase